MTAPSNIRAITEEKSLQFTWPDNLDAQLPFRFLRGRCPCAGCVNEFTGERMVHVEDIPEAIEIADVAFTGNYALKIVWSDRHDTGLYTWEYLRELCESDDATVLTDGL